MANSIYEYSAELIFSIVESKDDKLKILISNYVKNNGPTVFLNNIEQLDLPFDIHMKLLSLRHFVKYLD